MKNRTHASITPQFGLVPPLAALRSTVFMLLAGLGATQVRAAVLSSPKTDAQPQPELAAAAHLTAQRGLPAELPPHISTLLGLTREQTCPVMQGVLRSNDKIQGFEVTEKNHNDIVIFVVDVTTKDQTFYLTSPNGALRKVLSVRGGIGFLVTPKKADVEEFQSEKKIWEEHLALRAPSK